MKKPAKPRATLALPKEPPAPAAAEPPAVVEAAHRRFVFNLPGKHTADGLAYCSHLETTPNGVTWTVVGELAQALFAMQIEAEQRGVNAVMGAGE